MKQNTRARIRYLIHLEQSWLPSEAQDTVEATRRFHPVTHQPVEALHKQKKPEHDGEWNVELVTEDGKGQEGFCDEHPCLVIQPLCVWF